MLWERTGGERREKEKKVEVMMVEGLEGKRYRGISGGGHIGKR